jgi:hypothetical protein
MLYNLWFPKFVLHAVTEVKTNNERNSSEKVRI